MWNLLKPIKDDDLIVLIVLIALIACYSTTPFVSYSLWLAVCS